MLNKFFLKHNEISVRSIKNYPKDKYLQLLRKTDLPDHTTFVFLNKPYQDFIFNPKMAEGQFPFSVDFGELYLLKRGWNPAFFVRLNVILRHIFPEKFIEFPQVIQKIWRTSLSILAHFHHFFGFFDIGFLQRS